MSIAIREVCAALAIFAIAGSLAGGCYAQAGEPARAASGWHDEAPTAASGIRTGTSAGTSAATSTPSSARTAPRLGQGPHWHGDIGGFHNHDLGVWRSGHWRQGMHDGRQGWWWILDGVWYFYPRPTRPFPDPFVPPMVQPPPAGMTYWYYCKPYEQYYPYVATCPGSWRAVPAVR